MRVPGVILAAGEGSRFEGQNKLLLRFRGKPIIYHVVREALDSTLEPVFLVLGFEGKRTLKAVGELIDREKLAVLFNEDWGLGRASSVNVGIKALPSKAPGVVFLQGDMPLMRRSLIDLVVDKFIETGKLCFPIHKGKKGHPVAFPRELLPELQKLSGDRSGLSLIQKNMGQAVKLQLEDGRTQFDLDSDKEYQRLLLMEAR